MNQPTESSSPQSLDVLDESLGVLEETPTPDAATLVESYAEQLMEDLFGDVDRILSGDQAAIKTVLSASHAAAMSPSAVDEESSSLDMPLLSLTPQGTTVAATTKPKHWLRRHLRAFFLGGAAVAIAAVGGVWAFYQRQSSPEAAAPSAAVSDALDPQAQADAEFLQYLKRSLEVISSRGDAAGSASVETPQVAVLPKAPIPDPSPGMSPNPSGSINVIERVYIPYQSAQSVLPGQIAPGVSASNQAQPGLAAASAPQHTLVGILELGDRSAALFEIDGTPQRVSVGERIGSSGWNLVSISNQEAVIRRNGDVRSIYIGQRF